MTSAIDLRPAGAAPRAAAARAEQPSRAPVLWITGLSGVGKSTLAAALLQRLASAGEYPELLDGDALRRALDGPEAGQAHDLAARWRRAWRIARHAHALAAAGRPVIVATISLFHRVQAWNRQHHPRYAEVLLQAPLAVLRQHNPARYGTPDAPARQVWGIDQQPEFPPAPELALQQRFVTADLADHVGRVHALWRRLAAEGAGR